jgi:hypothetical protein
MVIKEKESQSQRSSPGEEDAGRGKPEAAVSGGGSAAST